MRKLKIYGVKNRDSVLYIIIKNGKFFETGFYKFLEALNIGNPYSNCAEDCHLVHTDYIEIYKSSKYFIEVFYGKKKVVISVRSSAKNRLKFITEIKNISDWIKPKLKKTKNL